MNRPRIGVKPMTLTDEQGAAIARGETVEIIPAPGEGKRLRYNGTDESGIHYAIEEVPAK